MAVHRIERLVVDLHLRPGGGMVGRHHHLGLREVFTVFEGRIAYSLNRQEAFATVGDRVDIPAGTLHDFWKSDACAALVRVDVQLQVALLAREFDDVIRYDKDPQAFQRLLFLVLTPLARAKGLKGNYAEYLERPPPALVPNDELDRMAVQPS